MMCNARPYVTIGRKSAHSGMLGVFRTENSQMLISKTNVHYDPFRNLRNLRHTKGLEFTIKATKDVDVVHVEKAMCKIPSLSPNLKSVSSCLFGMFTFLISSFFFLSICG